MEHLNPVEQARQLAAQYSLFEACAGRDLGGILFEELRSCFKFIEK